MTLKDTKSLLFSGILTVVIFSFGIANYVQAETNENISDSNLTAYEELIITSTSSLKDA